MAYKNFRRLLSTALLTGLFLGSCSSAVKTISNSPTIAETAHGALGDGFGNNYFYEPKFDYPRTPQTFGLSYSDISIPSSGGNTLHGWFIPATGGKAKSTHTVVYSHGNMGTVGYHVQRVAWLAKNGINVLMYDYRGYGKSTGKVSRKGLVEDAYHALRYASQRADLAHTKIVSHGHSLGGAKSVAALGSFPTPKRVVLAVDESSFASYKDMALIKGGVVGQKLVTETFSPEELIDDVKIPVIVIHGTADSLTPLSQGHKLRNAAQGKSLKYYWQVAGGSHYNCLTKNNNELRKRLLNTIKEL